MVHQQPPLLLCKTLFKNCQKFVPSGARGTASTPARRLLMVLQVQRRETAAKKRTILYLYNDNFMSFYPMF